jgi:hypothetical protein
MPQRRILFLDATRLTAYRISGTAVESEGIFAADPAGFESFTAYLAKHRSSIFMLLADVAEEGFQLEDIPSSSGRDRDAIIKRKLGQYFYGTRFSLALSEGRLKEGRRDERLLLMALTRQQQLDPWLEILRASHGTLAGIYSLPQLVAALLPANASGPVLQITQTLGGLRQTYFVDRQLRFSRMTSLATGSAEESAVAAALEASKMHQYLVSQRLVERNRPLPTRVLVHPAQVAAMRERCRDSANLHFEFVDLLQETKRLGLHNTLSDSCADMLFCHLLGRKTPGVQFAPPAERQFFRLWQTRFALKGASAVILAGGILFGAKQGLEILQMQSVIDQIELQTQADQQRYNTTMQALPKIPLSTDNLRAFIDRYDRVLKRAQGPGPLLVHLSKSLDAYPGITLARVEWKISEQLDPGTAASGTVVPGNMASGPYAIATVAAQLPLGMAGDHRGQLKLVADFAKHLGAEPDTLVTILQQPVDTQSEKTLKSGDETNIQEAPKFSFRMTRKL